MNAENNFQYFEYEYSNAVISLEDGKTFKISKFAEQLCYVFVNTALS